MRTWFRGRLSFRVTLLGFVLLLLALPQAPASAGKALAVTRPEAGRSQCSQPSKVVITPAPWGTWNADGTCSGYPEAPCGFKY